MYAGPFLYNINQKYIKALGLSLSWVLHLERGTNSFALELEEVEDLNKRAIGNWDTDVYGKYYDKKLPLAAMRAIPGHDSSRGYFNHARCILYDNATYAHLPSLSFPWVDEAIDKVWNTDNHTGFVFLALLKKRWVILKNEAVMIRQYNYTQYIYKQFDKLFEYDTFNKYADQMVDHLKLSEKTDPNKLGTLT